MRLYVFKTAKAHKAIAVFEYDKITKGKATITKGVSLASIQPGMVCCPGEGREPDRSTTYVVLEVEGNHIVFEKEALSGVTYTPLEEEGPVP